MGQHILNDVVHNTQLHDHGFGDFEMVHTRLCIVWEIEPKKKRKFSLSSSVIQLSVSHLYRNRIIYFPFDVSFLMGNLSRKLNPIWMQQTMICVEPFTADKTIDRIECKQWTRHNMLDASISRFPCHWCKSHPSFFSLSRETTRQIHYYAAPFSCTRIRKRSSSSGTFNNSPAAPIRNDENEQNSWAFFIGTPSIGYGQCYFSVLNVHHHQTNALNIPAHQTHTNKSNQYVFFFFNKFD